MTWQLVRGAGGFCAVLAVLLVSEAVAHPTTGFAKIQANGAQFETRLTLAISALSELAVLDPNADGTVTRSEIAAGLPQIRSKLLELLALKLNGERATLGEVVNVETLWPREREAGLLGGISLEASYLDITFTTAVKGPVDSFSLDCTPLFKAVTSLSGVEATCNLDGQQKATLVLNSIQPVATQERPPVSSPAKQAPDAAGSPAPPGEAPARSGGHLGLVAAVLLGAVGLLAVRLVRRRPKV